MLTLLRVPALHKGGSGVGVWLRRLEDRSQRRWWNGGFGGWRLESDDTDDSTTRLQQTIAYKKTRPQLIIYLCQVYELYRN
ncbi:unnamed protein product [Macrosiphum euphorbiae]|uniref:Uncharacterized protein n=1 Tax=Macrosiphum euphorbiae TaxID=13131 RepID=A0AAV0XXW9_9HEMI|nr:unnamed protein product [Macrosiphum euphorbiae]